MFSLSPKEFMPPSPMHIRHPPVLAQVLFTIMSWWPQAFFRFRIPEHGVSELFLFAGAVVEPDITVDRTRVDYGALMLGAALTETFHIVNREGMPHSFVFEKNSLGMAQVLYVCCYHMCVWLYCRLPVPQVPTSLFRCGRNKGWHIKVIDP